MTGLASWSGAWKEADWKTGNKGSEIKVCDGHSVKSAILPTKPSQKVSLMEEAANNNVDRMTSPVVAIQHLALE